MVRQYKLRGLLGLLFSVLPRGIYLICRHHKTKVSICSYVSHFHYFLIVGYKNVLEDIVRIYSRNLLINLKLYACTNF